MNEALIYLIKRYKEIFKEELQKKSHVSHEDILLRISIDNSIDFEKLNTLEELKDLYNCYYQNSYISQFLNLENLEEIIVHGHKSIEIIKNNGQKEMLSISIDKDDLELGFVVLGLRNKQNWNYQNPFCSFLLESDNKKFRCTMIHSCISPNQSPSVFFRKISNENFDLNNFIDNEKTNISKDFIKQLITSKKNFIVAGSTGSGKTSFLKSCLQNIPTSEHVIVIEDTNEIIFPQKNFTNLLASDEKNKTMKDFCKYAMRMSPERIILGEIRAEEVIPYILAMNTGHKGQLATIHANSARDALQRLAMLFSIFSTSQASISFEQILKLICSNVDYVIFLENKKIAEVIEVKGSEGLNPITNDLLSESTYQMHSTRNFFFAS